MSHAIVPTPFGPMLVRRARPCAPAPAPFGGFGLSPFELFSPEPPFKADFKETEEGYELDAELPGIDKADIKLSIEDDVLTISYEHKEEGGEKDDDGKWIRRERSVSSMTRSFALHNADEEKADAVMENGILKVNVPKKAEVEPEKKTIDIS